MSTQVKAQKAERAKNYTAEMVAELASAAPLDLAKAKTFADKFGKSYQSIIAKCLSEGIEYESKKPEAKRVNKEKTKAEMVELIRYRLNTSNFLHGLEKATAASLKTLFESLPENVS